jgi:hypothetical protein
VLKCCDCRGTVRQATRGKETRSDSLHSRPQDGPSLESGSGAARFSGKPAAVVQHDTQGVYVVQITVPGQANLSWPGSKVGGNIRSLAEAPDRVSKIIELIVSNR